MSLASLARQSLHRNAVTVSRERAQVGGVQNGAGSGEPVSALEQLTQYIPTETVTLFIAAVSAWTALHQAEAWLWLGPWGLIVAFTVLPPLMFWIAALATFAEQKRAKKIPEDANFSLPIFDMVAATIAFFVWSLAVPGLFDGAAVLQVLAAFAAVVVSWLLSKAALIFAGQ